MPVVLSGPGVGDGTVGVGVGVGVGRQARSAFMLRRAGVRWGVWQVFTVHLVRSWIARVMETNQEHSCFGWAPCARDHLHHLHRGCLKVSENVDQSTMKEFHRITRVYPIECDSSGFDFTKPRVKRVNYLFGLVCN